MAVERWAREFPQRFLIPGPLTLVSLFFFVVGATVLGVSGSALYDILRNEFGDSTGALAIILATSMSFFFLPALALLPPILRWLRALDSAPTPEFETRENVMARRGLVVMASLTSDVADKAVDYHRKADHGGEPVQYCWIVTTSAERSIGTSNFLKAKYEPLGVECFKCDIDDASNLQETYNVVGKIIDAARTGEMTPRLRSDQIIVDVTGGVAPMTAGAVMACMNRGIDPEYLYSPPKPDGSPDYDRSRAILLDISWSLEAGANG